MKRIKYICYYDEIHKRYKRNYTLAATTKIDYIVSALNKKGFSVDIISLSECTESSLVFTKVEKKTISDKTSLRLFFSWGLHSNRVSRVLKRLVITIQFIFWFILNYKRGEQIIVYHSLRIAKLLLPLQNILNLNIVGEIEEIYTDVQNMSTKWRKLEHKFIENCSAYLFPSQLLNERYNQYNKPSIIVHGLYSTEKDRNMKFEDNKHHIVYAGTFDSRKGGAAAAAAARFLPENFHVHICGFGNIEDTNKIKAIIKEVQKIAKATVSYEGLLKGEEFINFIQKCEIGLSTQDPSAKFNSTSFPSKILTYLSNGLKVVTIDISAIRTSGVGDVLFYYEEQTPEKIASTIISASQAKNFDGRSILMELDKKFIDNLDSIFRE